jgi:hypothetical protein
VFARGIGVLLARVDQALAQLAGAGATRSRTTITDLASARDRLRRLPQDPGFPWHGVETANEGRRRAPSRRGRRCRAGDPRDVSRANIVHDDRRYGLIDFGDAGRRRGSPDVAIALAQLAIVGRAAAPGDLVGAVGGLRRDRRPERRRARRRCCRWSSCDMRS